MSSFRRLLPGSFGLERCGRVAVALLALVGIGCGALGADELPAAVGLPAGLPDPLRRADGTVITTPADWSLRRAELRELFAREMYGRMPGRPAELRFELLESDSRALDGQAVRQQFRIHFTRAADGPSMDLLLYRPAAVSQPVPVILALNFWGNHAIHSDPAVRLSRTWMESGKTYYADLSCVTNHRATEACRGLNARQWPVTEILRRGYGLATVYRGDLHPDFPNAFTNALHQAYPELQGRGDNFTAMGAWAWGLSRAMDCLATLPAVEARRVGLFGWSRLGKAALWAAANDERFALVFSNESGAGGAKLFRRDTGEKIRRLNTVFPHWYAANFRAYNDRDATLPFDQHELIALIAPRPVYVASAVDDSGADPAGEFAALVGADPVYRLLSGDGLPTNRPPAPGVSVQGRLGYHVRPGNHDVLPYDWEQCLAFADRWLREK